MKYVLVIIGSRLKEKEVIAQFKAAHPLMDDDSFVKILIGAERLEQDSQTADPHEWVVRTPRTWRLASEKACNPLETYVRRRMKGGEVEVYFTNLDTETRRHQAISQELSALGWRPFAIKTLAAC